MTKREKAHLQPQICRAQVLWKWTQSCLWPWIADSSQLNLPGPWEPDETEMLWFSPAWDQGCLLNSGGIDFLVLLDRLPQLSALKQPTFIIQSYSSGEVWVSLAGACAPGFVRLSSKFKLDRQGEAPPTLVGVVVSKSQFLAVVGLRSMFPC